MRVVVLDTRMRTFGHTRKIHDKAQKYCLTGTCTPKTNKYPNLGYLTSISPNKKMLANFKFGIFFKFWSEEEVGDGGAHFQIPKQKELNHIWCYFCRCICIEEVRLWLAFGDHFKLSTVHTSKQSTPIPIVNRELSLTIWRCCPLSNKEEKGKQWP